MDKEKIEAIVNLLQQKSIKAMSGYLRTVGYYKKILRNFSHMATPLNAILKKGAFKWNDSSLEAFEI